MSKRFVLRIILASFFNNVIRLVWFCYTDGKAIKYLKEKPKNHKENSVSGFQALMVSTASRVGTGNIIGVSVAILSLIHI